MIGVAILARRASQGERGEAATIHFLNERFEGCPTLDWQGFPRVELLMWKEVRPDEQTDGVGDDLFHGEQNFSNDLDLRALLDPVKEHLGGIGRRHRAPIQCFVCKQHHHARLTISILQLVQDVQDRHRRVPTCPVGIVRDLELGRHVGIEHAEARLVDVDVGQEIILLAQELRVDRTCVVRCGPHGINGCRARIRWNNEYLSG